MSQHKRLYNSKAWKKKRLDQLYKEPLCRYCLARGVTKAASVADHIIPHRGNLELFYHGALQSLCPVCHSSAKAQEEHGKDW